MKNNQMVRDLIEKAMAKGEAVVNKRGTKVYEAYKKDGKLELIHYGTTILEYDLNSKTVTNYGGYSASDRDALNNTLDVLNHSGESFRIRQRSLELV